MRHFYNYRTNREGLKEHFDFAGESSWKFYSFRLAPMPKYGNKSFPCDDYARKAPLDYEMLCSGEIKKFRLADESENDKRAADENFVGKRVNYSAEFAGDIQLSCHCAIDHICQGGDNKNKKSNVEITGERHISISRQCWFEENHRQENHAQYEPAERQDIRQMF